MAQLSIKFTNKSTDAIARFVKDTYDSFVNIGFSEEQALTLTRDMIRVSMIVNWEGKDDGRL